MRTLLIIGMTLNSALWASSVFNTGTSNLPDGYTVYVQGIRIDSADGLTPISQVSDYDGVCIWLGYKSYVSADVSKDSKETLLIDEKGNVTDPERSPYIENIYCRTAKHTGAKSTTMYDRKVKEESGWHTIYGPYVLPTQKVYPSVPVETNFYYSLKTDLDGLCKLYGYSKSITSRSQTKYNTSTSTLTIIDNFFVLNSSALIEQRETGANDYITEVTCEK